MKILQVGKHYPPHVGGMETVLQNIAEGLLASGDEVSVLVAGGGSLERREILRDPASGHTGILVRASCVGRFNSQPLTVDLVNALRAVIAERRPDVVHLHLPNPLAAAAWLVWRNLEPGPKPVLAVWHHADMVRQKVGRRLVGPLVAACLRQAAGVCVSSRTHESSSRELSSVRARVRVIPFGIAPLGTGKTPGALGGSFLFVGRLVRYKGLPILLKALATVPEARLTMVGTGPQEGELRQMVRDLGLRERVRFTGHLSRPDLGVLLAEARALVLPSLDASETFGLVQLEAMAAGTAVIVADLPTGVSEVGEPGVTGLIVAPGDRGLLARAMNRLQQDPELAHRMGLAGRRRYQELFTRQRMIDRLRGWYGELLHRPGRSG